MNWAETLIRDNLTRPLEKKRIILYFTQRAQAMYCYLEDLPSFLIGGMPKHGKTSTMAFYCGQIVMAGGQVIVIDPHSGAPRDSLADAVSPLAPWFALPVLDFTEVDSSEVVNYFHYVMAEYLSRKRRNGTAGKKPLYLVVDEWNEMLDYLDQEEAATVLEIVRTVARGGRKYGMYIALAAQQWQLSQTGGSGIRKNVAGRIAFNAELSDIALVLDSKDRNTLKSMVAKPLAPGDAIMKIPGSGMGMQRVRFLFTEHKASQIIADLIKAVYAGSTLSPTGKSALSSEVTPEPESFTASPPAFLPDERIKLFSSATPNTSPPNLNIQVFTPNNLPIQHKKGVKITEETIQAIIEEGNKQIRESGRVNRTLIRDRLGWNSHGYQKIDAVCDALGWNLRMSKDEIGPGIWEAIKKHYDYTCQRCHRSEPLVTLEPDRIVPGCKGGSYTPGNIQPLCKSCNSSKRERIVDYRQARGSEA
jgi:HNH endonuclease